MHVFNSKIDKAILLCLILSIVACLLGISVMLKIGGGVNYAIAIFMLAFGVGFPLWIMLSTKYIVTDETLEIISGPFGWNIPMDSILSVTETQKAITSPALSFDRLEIKYGEEKIILISPKDKQQFIQKLGRGKLTGLTELPGGDKKIRHPGTGRTAKSIKKQQKRQRNASDKPDSENES